MPHRMHPYDWSLIGSTLAIVLAQINQAINNGPTMELVTAVGAVVMCLTAIVKFIDLLFEKWQKWKRVRTPRE